MISKKIFPIIIFIYFFQYVNERNLNYFNFWQFLIFHSKMYDWVIRKSSFSTKQYITLEPRKSLVHHDIQKIISYHNLYLFFPICKWKEFKLFQLVESFKKMCLCTIHVLRNLWLMQVRLIWYSVSHIKLYTTENFLTNQWIRLTNQACKNDCNWSKIS